MRSPWIVLLVGLFASNAHASEVPPNAPVISVLPSRAGIDAAVLRRTRDRFWAGVGLGLAGPALFVLGAAVQVNVCGIDTCGSPAGWSLMVMGVGSGLVGVVLSSSSAGSSSQHLRRGGVRVPRGLAVAAVVVPVTFIPVGAAIAFVGSDGAGIPLLLAGYVSPFLLGGAQMAENRSHLRRALPVTFVPTRIGHSPGLAVAVRW